jgi:hypothetical protein
MRLWVRRWPWMSAAKAARMPTLTIKVLGE